MEKFTVTLSDGTQLTNLWLNGNNYTTAEQISEETFEGKLSHVTIESTSGAVTEYDNAELVQVQECEDGYRFILREKSELTILLETLRARLNELGA